MANIIDLISLLFPKKQEPVEEPTILQQVAQKPRTVEDDLYDAFAEAETGSFENKYIRTTFQPKGGSTAFGPVQITSTKAADYAGLNPKGRKTAVISPESVEFVKDVLLPMQEKMSKYGGKDMKPGFEDYDYGGSGQFDVKKYKEAYEKLAKEMLKFDYESSKGDINQTIRKWRGTGDDERYNKVVLKKFNRSK